MDIPPLPLKYTICFTLCGTKVLLIKRKKEPYINMWNGLGGKIEGDETPRENILREMQEEAAIDLRQAEKLTYVGIVTWDSTRKEGVVKNGMYAFIAYVTKDKTFTDRETREGLLSWKELDWLYDKKNTEVAENIRLFLPSMLESKVANYACTYMYGKLTNFSEKPLLDSSISHM